MREVQFHFLLYTVIEWCLLHLVPKTFQEVFKINKHCVRDNGAHLWEKYAFFAYLFLCRSSKWWIPYLMSVYVLCNSNVWTFYHNNPFLSVSYLHCFLFVCFYFRPLNKKSKVRCLKLFFIIFFIKARLLICIFIPLQDGREKSVKGTEGWGQTSAVTSPWSHLWGFMVYCSIYYHFKNTLSQDLPYSYLLNHHFLTYSLDLSVEHTYLSFSLPSESCLVWSSL